MMQVFDWMMQKNMKKMSWCSWFECPHCNCVTGSQFSQLGREFVRTQYVQTQLENPEFLELN